MRTSSEPMRVVRRAILAAIAAPLLLAAAADDVPATDPVVTASDDEPFDFRPPEPRLAPMPTRTIDPARHRADERDIETITNLIERLVEVNDPYAGGGGWQSDVHFGVGDTNARLWSPAPRIEGADAGGAELVRQLVEFGPKALPLLLAHIDDPTPSAAVLRHDGGFGGMWHVQELHHNPLNEREVSAARETVGIEPVDGWVDRATENVRTHTITRGDLCYLALGRIVNRSYLPVRYQPTACLILNSPTQNPVIADAVRSAWRADDLASALFQSLLIDLHSRGGAADFQLGAALRLMRYFPEESRDILVDRLDALDVRRVFPPSDGMAIGVMEQYAANGEIHTASLLEGLGQFDDPQLLAARLRAMERTDEPYVLAAVLDERTTTAAPLVALERIRVALGAENAEIGPFGGQYLLLRIAVLYFADDAPELFATFLRTGTADARRAVLRAVRGAREPLPWVLDLLAPLLDDMTATGWHYGPEYDQHPILVCDEVAQTLAEHLPGATFELEGDRAELDRQIERIRRRLAGEVIVDDPIAARERPDFDAVQTLEPFATLVFEESVGVPLGISDAQTIVTYAGYGDEGGWAMDTLTIDTATGRITDRVRLDIWRCGVSLLRPAPAGVAYVYRCDSPAAVVVRDVRSGAELARVQTPFNRGVSFDDPMQVRNLGDVVVTSDGAWIVATTPDHALHEVEVATGRHEVVWRPDPPADGSSFRRQSLTAMEGTNTVLVEVFGSDQPLRIWDHDQRRMLEVEKVPRGAGRRAGGT